VPEPESRFPNLNRLAERRGREKEEGRETQKAQPAERKRLSRTVYFDPVRTPFLSSPSVLFFSFQHALAHHDARNPERWFVHSPGKTHAAVSNVFFFFHNAPPSPPPSFRPLPFPPKEEA
jgi:hypothetical protein